MSRTAIILSLGATIAVASARTDAFAQSRWPAGDEIGMANNLGPATWQRCAPPRNRRRHRGARGSAAGL